MQIFLFAFLSLQTNCGVANLVDNYLGPLYPDYVSHTRLVLVRQARDLLVCTFHGDLQRFEEEFLCPAADIVARIKHSHHNRCETVIDVGGFSTDHNHIETVSLLRYEIDLFVAWQEQHFFALYINDALILKSVLILSKGIFML